MKKIGLVLSQPPGYSETFFNSKIKGLQENGYEVILFTGPSQETYKLCTHIKIPSVNRFLLLQIFSMCWVGLKLLPNMNTVWKFAKLERQDGSAIKRIFEKIYLNAPLLKFKGEWLHYGFGTLAIDRELVAQAVGAKMAVSFRGFDIGVYPLKHPDCYHKLWSKVSKIHVISNDIADLIYKHGFKDQAPIVKITPAIDTQYFSASKKSKFNNPMQLITVARLHWKKGLVVTLEALAILKTEKISFEFRIIGTGLEEESLKFACYQLGIQEEVKFLGKLEHCQVKEELAKSDIYIQYSVQEGFCNAVLEAQAMGLLCVVSDAEGLSENVQDGYSGWVVPKYKPNLLADKLLEVLELPSETKTRISQQAINRVKEHFSLEQQKQAFHEFYLI